MEEIKIVFDVMLMYIGYTTATVLILMSVQAIFYNVFKINLYKKFCKLFKLEK